MLRGHSYWNLTPPVVQVAGDGLQPGDAAYDVNVDAGENGMTCLTFNGETIRVLLTSPSASFVPATCSVRCILKKHILKKHDWRMGRHGMRKLSHAELQGLCICNLSGIYNDSPGFIPAA